MVLTKDKPAVELTTRSDGYRTLLVHVEPGLASTHRVEVAGRLARDLDAKLIGLGAEAFNWVPVGDPFMGYASGEWAVMAQEQMVINMKSAETAFRRDAGGADLEWRTMESAPVQALTRYAHACDLVVVGPRSPAGAGATADPAELVIGLGRPVLMAPEARTRLHGRAVVVAWKDTRECRRAITDAMPFLRRAEDVIVHGVCGPDEAEAVAAQLSNLVSNLKRHGVEARATSSKVPPEQTTAELQRVAALNEADLIVAGAYGHSRFREWVLGGVTDDLMHQPQCFVLFSH